MIEEKAFVVETDSEYAWVETQRQTTCNSCGVKKACGTSVLQKVLGQKRTRLKVLNPNHYKAGDAVVLGLQENALVKGSLLMYGLPLLFMFGFAILGYLIFVLYGIAYSEPAKIGFSLAGLAMGFVYIARMNKGINVDPKYQAVILRKFDSSANEVRLV